MMSDIRLTVLAENTVYKQGLIAEHGLSLLIEVDGEKILFDTGQGMTLAHNMNELGIDPESIDSLVLSHSHYDHTSGVQWVLQNNSDLKVYLHSEALKPCFSKRNTLIRDIGMPQNCKDEIEIRKESVIWSDTPTTITPNVTLTGSIPRLIKNEMTDTFYKDAGLTELNTIPDDQAMFIKTSKGLVVILGCNHSGLANTVSYIFSLVERNSIYALIGGMHLRYATSDQVTTNVLRLKELGVQILAPGHCTGFDSLCSLKTAFDQNFIPLSAGTVIEL